MEAEVLAVVADKTGYPADMLDLDLDLEADLGIDTVKQAEVFALIRERFGIERDDKLKLRDYPTLAHVIGFVRDRAPGSGAVAAAPEPEPTAAPAQAEPEPAVAEPEPAAPAADLDVEAEVLAVVADKTGYPADMLDLDLDLEADLGIDTVKQAEVFALIRERFGIERDDKLKLRDYPTLAHVIGFVRDRAPGSGAVAAAPEPEPTAAPAQAEPEPAVAEPEPAARRRTWTWRPRSWRWWPTRPATPPTCWTSTSTSKPTSASTPSNRPRCSPSSANASTSNATTSSSSATTPPSPTSSASSATGHPRPATAARPEATASATEAAPSDSAPPVVIADVTDADRVPRRVPVPTIRPPLAVCAPTGVELEAGMRVVVAFDRGGVGAALADRLTARGVEVLAVDDQPDADDLVARIDGWLADGPIHGVYWLAALDHEGALDEMDLAAWREANRVRVKLLYATMRRLYDQISGPGTFLVTATRLGGRHGYDEAGAYAPLGGAVTGFAKAFARERPDALVKAVDFDRPTPPDRTSPRCSSRRRCTIPARSRSATPTGCGGR